MNAQDATHIATYINNARIIAPPTCCADPYEYMRAAQEQARNIAENIADHIDWYMPEISKEWFLKTCGLS